MGCCQVKEASPFTEAARLLRSTYPNLRDIVAQNLVRGSYGFPFRCVDEEEDVDVFAKVSRVRSYTRRALHILSTTSLEQTLTPLTYRISGDHVVVLYPWISGGDLVRNMSHFITHARKERIMTSLLRAVHELHACGIAHRDIKMENVLLKRDTCILIDTDTCDWATELYYSGTANYMPPTSVVHKVMHHTGIARSDKMFWLDTYALGKLLAKLLLIGTVSSEERRIWNMWVERDRASPSAVRLLLTQRRSKPWWKFVYWWCVDNEQQLMEDTPYIKGMDEAISILGSGIRDK